MSGLQLLHIRHESFWEPRNKLYLSLLFFYFYQKLYYNAINYKIRHIQKSNVKFIKKFIRFDGQKIYIISYFGQVCRNTLCTLQKFKEFEYYHHETAYISLSMAGKQNLNPHSVKLEIFLQFSGNSNSSNK